MNWLRNPDNNIHFMFGGLMIGFVAGVVTAAIVIFLITGVA